MPFKILSKAGESLADSYNTKGNIAGLDFLATERTVTVHEMGETMFSERYSQFVRNLPSGDIAQNITFETVLAGLPSGIVRVESVIVGVDATSRLTRMAVSARYPNQRDIPIWVWDGSGETTIIMEKNATIAAVIVLDPDPLYTRIPQLLASDGQPQAIESLVMAGTTSGFGGGTIDTEAFILLSLTQVGGISNVGLPIPGW